MRLLTTVSYDGTAYAGYQVQPNALTIQEKIEQALSKIHKGQEIRIVASGRTDAGVHAVGQTFHFDTDLKIPETNWKRALNAVLPNDIYIDHVQLVPDDFHARFDVKTKKYQYYVLNNEDKDVFQRNYSYFVKESLDIVSMQQACTMLEGEHDFTAFCAANAGVKGTKVRTIYQATCEQHKNQYIFTFEGSGFLYNMVRIIVGTLIEVGKGNRKPMEIREILVSKDRSKAGKTAPPQGLFLTSVTYN
ncbi:tRNA pseudouridine synthase A [Paraliobacillus sp. PM-2]|uniref:tRNA pseudouridine(38-40) synthase TruA n=1 Tax=Paraliobacillus sp. PM-2 TaxID=1462524 RepID=UPI00061BF1A4|nr:tRNA pseudouridine(38-40) synthase TruA [Paraliobacillus sp. PM-2]CQR48491.1 tRNA pseudouridine synthase A [Paraliobacillus sp. PM-2]